MALAYVMNFSGQTTAIGAALAATGVAYAFLSPVLGWIGTAVAGSATSAGALFANLQATAAQGAGLDPQTRIAAAAVGAPLMPGYDALAVPPVGGRHRQRPVLARRRTVPVRLRRAGPVGHVNQRRVAPFMARTKSTSSLRRAANSLSRSGPSGAVNSAGAC